MNELSRQGASVIFLNRLNEVLLVLRDDKPGIPYPNQWDLLGGGLEAGETPLECIRREMQEEIEYDLREPIHFGAFRMPDRTEHLFWQRTDFEISRLPLHEGQRLRWFSEEEIRAMAPDALAFQFREVLVAFFDARPFAT
jgi:8-oxo-dGTP diphosphatase